MPCHFSNVTHHDKKICLIIWSTFAKKALLVQNKRKVHHYQIQHI